MRAARWAEADDRERAFYDERAAQAKRLASIQRATADEITAVLREAQTRIAAQLARAGSDYQRWSLRALQAEIARALQEVETRGIETLSEAARRAFEAGADLVEKPIAAAGITLPGTMPSIDLRQLERITSFLTDRVRDITAEQKRRIDVELSLVIAGQQSPGEAVSAVEQIVEGGRKRALTIVRTEVGRAYAVATQDRLEQFGAKLPGLKKQWRRSGKLHSRPAHDAADGQVRDVGQPFVIDKIELMHPRDPSAPAEQTINCGCTSLPYMERWDMAQPRRQPFTDHEVRNDRRKRELDMALAEHEGQAPQPLSTLMGKGGANERETLIEHLDTRDESTSRAKVAAVLHDAAFAAFLKADEPGSYPVAIVPAALREQLGTAARVLRFSHPTARKQRDRHPELNAADYQRIQSMLESGSATVTDRRVRVDYTDERGWTWRLVAKATEKLDEIYLVSYHGIRKKQAGRARRTPQR